MKPTLLTLALAFFLSAPSANATRYEQKPCDPKQEECKPGQHPPHPGKPCPRLPHEKPCDRLVQFNLVCHYKSKKQDDRYQRCKVAAEFEKFVTADGAEIRDDSEYPYNPRMEVSCDEYLLHNDSARRFTNLLGTRIQAQIGPYPAILLPRGSLHDGHHYAQSYLEIEDQSMRGACYIYTGNP